MTLVLIADDEASLRLICRVNLKGRGAQAAPGRKRLYFPMHVDETRIAGFAATDILYPPFSYTLTIDEPAANKRAHALASLGYDEQLDIELCLPYNPPLLPSDVGSPDRADM